MAKADRRNASVADISFGATSVTAGAITVAEATALTRVECAFIDGLDTPRSGSGIAIHALCDTETAEIAGRITNDPVSFVAFREFDGTDAYWALFDDGADPNPVQNMLVARAGYSGGTPTIGDVVDWYELSVSARSPMLGDEESQRFDGELRVVAYHPDEVLV